MKDMYGIRADELDMHSIIAESIIGFLLQHTGIMIQRQDISMNSSVCAAAVPLLPRFGISPESLLNVGIMLLFMHSIGFSHSLR